MTFAVAWLFVKNSFSNIFTFCSRPPGSYIAAVAAVALALWWYGQHEFNKGVASVAQKQIVATARLVQTQQKITVNVGNIYADVRLTIVQATDKRLSEVTAHVTPQQDRDCPIALGFVRVWNDAAHGPVPGPAAGTDDAASGIALSDIAKLAVKTDGQYDETAAQLTALQDWIRQQQALSEKSK